MDIIDFLFTFASVGAEKYRWPRHKTQDILLRTLQRLETDERMQFIPDCRQTDIELHSERSGEIDLLEPYDAAIESMHAAADD